MGGSKNRILGQTQYIILNYVQTQISLIFSNVKFHFSVIKKYEVLDLIITLNICIMHFAAHMFYTIKSLHYTNIIKVKFNIFRSSVFAELLTRLFDVVTIPVFIFFYY